MLSDDLLEGAAAIGHYIGKSERATFHLIYQNQIPVIRKGRRIFARKSELERSFSSEAA